MEMLGMGILMLLVILAVFVLYVITLVRQARKKQWVWFVLTLLFGVTMLVYWPAKWLHQVK